MSRSDQPIVSASAVQTQHNTSETDQTLADVSEIFRDALDSFVKNLSQSEKKDFSEHKDAQSVIDALQTITEKHPIHHSRLTNACRKFQHLVNRLQPYFDVVDTFIQAKPEYMAPVWGSLKMIFKLSSNYVNFLDKMADIFGNISDQLPLYEEYVTFIRGQAAVKSEAYTRLEKVLGYLYADILGFCYSAYTLFANPKPRFATRIRLVSRLIWQPFDVKYSAFISRIRQHKDLLSLEWQLASMKEVVGQLKRYEGWYTGNTPQPLDVGREERERTEKDQMLKRVEELKTWIDPPRWTERLEEAQKKRTPDTGDWILDNELYQRWKRFDREPDRAPESRILTIRGKVGYGKTTLCSVLVDDLGSYAIDAECAAIHTGHSVIFYFFDKRSGNANAPTDAIRAMLTQLIHLHRLDKYTVDIASIIFMRNETGQTTASCEEVLAVLRMLLDHLEFTYLVFDGIDECSNPPELLEIIQEIAKKSKTSALSLIGRPSFQLPANFSVRIDLDPSQLQHNSDMRKFLRPLLQELPDEWLFLEELDLNETVDKITKRANGIFLWAKLLIDYLKLPSLTTHDRVDIIDNLSSLPDLDSLYQVILVNLESRFPGASLNSVSRLFQLVAYARRPLTLVELHYAISIPFDRQQTRCDLIPDIMESIGPLSGSLIEVSGDGKVQFIHVSAQEYYLAASLKRDRGVTSSRLFANGGLASRNIAASCLSYILHTVPPEPLSGSSQVRPNALAIKRKYPFLEYSTASWGNHFRDSFQELPRGAESATSGDATWLRLSHLLCTFLDRESTITLWIEASWLFKKRPVAPQLPSLDSIKSILADNPEALRLICEARKPLKDLFKDLEILRESWSHVLIGEPNEIWQPSISAFTKSPFWISTNKARVIDVPLFQAGLKEFIVIRSQLSQDGTCMGVVKLIPTKQWLDKGKPEHNDQEHSQDSGGNDISCETPDNWTARYELWCLVSNSFIKAVEINLSDDDMRPFVMLPSAANTNKFWRVGLEPTVSLPLSISDDLHMMIIINTIVTIQLDESRNKSNSEQATIAAFNYQVLNINNRIAVIDPNQIIVGEFYRMKFSPSNKYLAIIHRDLAAKFRPYNQPWILQIFRDENHSSKQMAAPKYIFIKALGFSTDAFMSPLRGVAFHPSAPRLAFAQYLDCVSETYLWDFEKPFNGKPNPFAIHDPPIIDPVFSDNGCYLYGTGTQSTSSAGQPLIFKLPAPIEPECTSLLESKKSQCLQETMEQSQSQSLASFHTAVLELAAQPQPPVQRANVLFFDKDAGGVAHMSRLCKLTREGAVVLTTLGLDGQLRNETLSRLPKEAQRCDVSVIHELSATPGMKDAVRIVLDRSSQEFYSHEDLITAPPAVVEQEKDSIPSYVTTIKLDSQQVPPALLEPLRENNSEGVSEIGNEIESLSF